MVTTIALLVACASKHGEDFNSAYVQQIKRGVTTKAEVRENLGTPPSVTTTGQGDA